MTTYRASRRDLAIADEATESIMACTFCNTLTPVADLNTYGARCFSCYRSYCTGDRYFPPLSVAQRREMAEVVRKAIAGGLRASPRDHIAYLEAKEAAGTASPAQRGFLAAVRNSAKVQRDE